MDSKKIATFMKQLRSEKGYTQEQLGEVLGVSGRTVSRWETGVNLPELSILMQMADFYNVEINELLLGEREANSMNEEMKETLKMASDYNEILKKKAIRDSNIAFVVTFITCALAILVQMMFFDSRNMIMGETAVLLVGGLTYIILLIKDGAWDIASKIKNTKKNNLIVSIGTALVISLLFYFKLVSIGTVNASVMYALGFFVIMSIVCYLILRGISALSERKNNSN